MSTHFITNQDKLLGDVVNNILPSSNRLSFLVGYFYFSGFKEIYENIKDKKLRILVGLEIENTLSNKIQEFELISSIELSRGKIRQKYYESLTTLFNDTDFFDTEEQQEAFKVFLDKIQDGSLEIRKTSQPNHAKLYIFENKKDFNQQGEFPGTVITGSSNLSLSGLRKNFEINIISRDARNFKEAEHIFNSIWQEAVQIVNKDNLHDFFQNVVEKIWFDKLPRPFLLYVRVLEEYFATKDIDLLHLPSDITNEKYINLKYQVDAVQKAIDILQRHNGVIIADVVGLGKSIITAAVAHNLNKKTIIIAPPHLKAQWEDYRFDFEFNAKVYTSGKIEEALKDIDDNKERLIVIDEAHKYRNELTEDYANLHKLCQRNKVILLTATPFNNRPQDIFSMIKLFQIPTRSTIQTVDNLSYQFKKLITEYQEIKKLQIDIKSSPAEISSRIKKVASDIRNILSPLVIRRSRLDLDAIKDYRDDLKQQKISFPKVNDPEILEYNLDTLSDLYEETLACISPETTQVGFVGARYMPTSYIKNLEKYKERIAKEMGVEENLLKQSQINIAKFMKRLLVRRFESSIFAFQKTLRSLIRQSVLICDWYEKLEKVPIYKKGKIPNVEALLDASGEEITDELKNTQIEKELETYTEKGLWCIEAKELKKQFIIDVKNDISLLKKIEERWFSDGIQSDPKLQHFQNVLHKKLKENKHRKIVVFTEFTDTAEYLYKHIDKSIRAFKYSASDASTTNKRIIKENFDASSKVKKNDYDVLIATDAISEGFNLHRAGIIFNYDIPYNPTRVIQRVGRINRINKKVFDELFIYNFFPTATGERETRIKKVSTLKIAMIHALFGEDTKVLTKDEELNSFFTKQFKETMRAQEELSPEVKHEDFIRNLRKDNPAIILEAMKIPKRCRIQRQATNNDPGVAVFGKKGQEFSFRFATTTNEGTHALPPNEALNLFEANVTEQGFSPSKDFNALYTKIRSTLFAKKTEVAMDRGKRDAILKIQAMIQEIPHETDYLKDLIYTIKELDALPARHAKLIRAISANTLASDFKNIKKEIPHSYLLNIMEREQQIEDGREELIVSEEFR